MTEPPATQPTGKPSTIVCVVPANGRDFLLFSKSGGPWAPLESRILSGVRPEDRARRMVERRLGVSKPVLTPAAQIDLRGPGGEQAESRIMVYIASGVPIAIPVRRDQTATWFAPENLPAGRNISPVHVLWLAPLALWGSIRLAWIAITDAGDVVGYHFDTRDPAFAM